MEIRIQMVRGPVVKAVTARTGVTLILRRATIERGLRGARLLSPLPSPEKPRKVKPKPARKSPPSPPNETSDKVLRLYEKDALTLALIAERLGMSQSMAQTHLTRARYARQSVHASAP
jgi:hypothetical protein